MKVGCDSVLLGSWANVSEADAILDVGSGCGLLALMCAQRNHKAHIIGVELSKESVEESLQNFISSPWSDRLAVFYEDFVKFAMNTSRIETFDYIISNPPYFNAGRDSDTDDRMRARHQGSLSPIVILEHGNRLLKPGGTIGMVLPKDEGARVLTEASSLGFELSRLCRVQGREDLPDKRWLLELSKKGSGLEKASSQISSLILEEALGIPTDAHRELCRDFYLKW